MTHESQYLFLDKRLFTTLKFRDKKIKNKKKNYPEEEEREEEGFFFFFNLINCFNIFY